MSNYLFDMLIRFCYDFYVSRASRKRPPENFDPAFDDMDQDDDLEATMVQLCDAVTAPVAKVTCLGDGNKENTAVTMTTHNDGSPIIPLQSAKHPVIILINYFHVCNYITKGVKMPTLLMSNIQNFQKTKFCSC